MPAAPAALGKILGALPGLRMPGRRFALEISETVQERFLYAPLAVTRPSTAISRVQFDYDPHYDRGSLRPYLCTDARHFWILAREIEPNARVPFDDGYARTRPCIFKWPATRFWVGDVVEAGLGVGESPDDASANLHYYCIRRTALRLELVGAPRTGAR